MHTTMSLGSNGVDWVRSLRKIRMRLHGTNFCINAPGQPILHRVSCCNKTLPNAPKYYETHQNMSLWSNGVDRVRSLRKIPMRFHGTNLSINCTGSTCLHRVLCSNETLPNTPKHYETHTDMSLGSNEVDRVRSLRKIPMRFHGTNLSINCTGSTRLHRVCVVTKHCQIHPNTTRRSQTWV